MATMTSEEPKAKKDNGNGDAVVGALVKAKSGITPHDLAYAFAASGYFHDVRKVSQAIVKIAAGAELGLGPMASVNGIHFIEGQLAPGANVMATLIRRSPDYDYKILELNDLKCTIRYFRRAGNKWEQMEPDVTFTIDDARRAGLVKPRSGYEKHPQNMLFARAMSNGFKWHCPELAGGMPLYDKTDMEGIVEGEFVEEGSAGFLQASDLAGADRQAEAVGQGWPDPEEQAPRWKDEEFPPAPQWEGGPAPAEHELPQAPQTEPRQKNQWEDEIRTKAVALGLVENDFAVVAILNRSPLLQIPFGRLKLETALGWVCAWVEVTTELTRKAPSEQRQAVATERWSAARDKYIGIARRAMGLEL